ncbi:class I SAM-dependent methyltransferase [Faecalibacter rhinopitheci]|uniref:class I SAM-dependent methyltransferase n=1 Tax=Faecalibacter rhinopitheci TaxID=2779678 RepID=UPI00293C0DF5|nr:class I SAM-dependent methyltransferase [Faecalibacter rhinopitheci]
MINETILTPEFQAYLSSIEKEDIRAIGLKKSPFPEINSAEIAQQLKGLQVSKNKFPTFYKTQGIYFPPSINLEQASSEATANYKASLIQGNKLIDLTAGLGIDSLAFSNQFEEVIHIEQNQILSEIVAHNVKILEKNIHCFQGTFDEYFEKNPSETFDTIYLDPARRNASGRKFILEDLEPNILEYLPTFFEKTEQIMVKLSPLLDLSLTINQISCIKEIHIVALKNEVKDFLIILDKSITTSNPTIVCVNLETEQSSFTYKFNEESESFPVLGGPKKYLYEPNSAILKAGGFKIICSKYDVFKLHQNTHLYTSDALISDFPGRIFEILEVVKNPKKEINKTKANLLVKNNPDNIDTIKKKFKINDGGDITLIFTQSIDGVHIFKTKRI